MMQGKITARELTEAGVPVVYTDDMAFGHLWQMHKRKINIVLMGIDSIRKDGIVNKVGSYPIAVFAKENRIPVYFVGELMKIDRRKKIEIEERNPEEIIKQIELPKAKLENPSFDSTPYKYIDKIICEKGILTPRQLLKLF